MSVCLGCQHEVPVTAAFCPRCGTPNPESPTVPTPTEATGRTTERVDPDDLKVRLQAALGRDFAVGQLLGEGGFAVVFAAQDRKLSRRVAVKVLRPELTSSKSTVQRFVREAEAAASLNHPHILPIFFVGEGEGLVYFGMPYVEGETLDALLAREGPLPEAEARRIGADIADALAEAHGAGLVHRDIKPGNVLLQGKKRRVLVADFGIAKAAAGSGDKLTGTGVVIGSPHYMSPEQASGSETVDHRSDVYSLGVVLWQMLAGSLPFEGPDSQGVLVQHLTKPLPPLRNRRKDVSGEFSRIVERTCAKKPEDRFQGAADVAEALRGGAFTPVRAARSRTRLALALGVGGIALAGAAALVVKWPGAGAGPTVAAAAPVRSSAPLVAVLPFEVSGGDTARATNVARMLAQTLDRRFGVPAVDFNELRARWVAERHALSDPVSRNASFAYGLGANQMALGSIVDDGTQVRVSLDVYDTQAHARIGRASLDGRPGQLIALMDMLAESVAVAFCQQPEFNPSNLCFDVPPRPREPLLVEYSGARPPEPPTVVLRVSSDGILLEPRAGTATAEVLTAALPVLARSRFFPATRRGVPVEAWFSAILRLIEPGAAARGPAPGPVGRVPMATRQPVDSPRAPVPLAPAASAAAATGVAYVTIGSQPATARMLINGRAVPSNPIVNYAVPPGAVRVRFEWTDSSGRRLSYDMAITVTAGQTLRQRVDLGAR